MRYYSTRDKSLREGLEQVVKMGLAPDGGLFMPERIPQLPREFFENIDKLSFQDIACEVAKAFFGDDVPQGSLEGIVRDTLSFDCPVQKVEEGIYALELFHGPTLAFKDVGGRFMARMLSHFGAGTGEVNVLVATSGDTGSAVANGFLGVPGIHVYVLYPKGKVSPIQECQFTTLGQNITALEVDGVFDDCQALVKRAFLDEELKARLTLTSANSINVARFLPQSFYYFNAYARMKELGLADELVISVPSGNFGNLCSGLFAKRMGLPIKRFIAANNANDVVYEYLRSGVYSPRASVQTIANAMDVGAPSNFERILDLYGARAAAAAAAAPATSGPDGAALATSCDAGDLSTLRALREDLSGARYSDEQIRAALRSCLERTGYQLDPHGACGYLALRDGLRPGECGVFLETAHPAKFTSVVQDAVGAAPTLPARLAAFMQGEKRSLPLPNSYAAFRAFLLSR
ncbi:MAG: threonine synthase [Bacteroidales bacterium]|nr:threonine synthase [Bacteroidales bacterium]